MRRMPTIDSLTHILMQKPECFADAFNLVLFGGRQVIRSEKLTPCDPKHVFHPDSPRRKRGPSFYRERDVFKKYEFSRDGKTYCVYLGIENQTHANELMTERDMMYDALALDNQAQTLRDEARRKRQLKTAEELVSGVPTGTKLCPVITLTPFFSNKFWSGPRCMHDLLHVGDKAFLRFVPNYPLHLLVPAEMSTRRIGRLRSELRVIFSFLHCSASGGDVQVLLNSVVGRQNISWHATALLKALLHVDIKLPNTRKETTTMCQAMEKFQKKIYDLGKTDGYDLGKTDMIRNMLRAKLDPSLISQIAGVSEEKVREIGSKGKRKRSK